MVNDATNETKNARKKFNGVLIDIDAIGLRCSPRSKELNDAKANRIKISKAFSLIAIAAR